MKIVTSASKPVKVRADATSAGDIYLDENRRQLLMRVASCPYTETMTTNQIVFVSVDTGELLVEPSDFFLTKVSAHVVLSDADSDAGAPSLSALLKVDQHSKYKLNHPPGCRAPEDSMETHTSAPFPDPHRDPSARGIVPR